MAQDLAGFLGLAALMVTLVAWLRSEMNGRFNRIDGRIDRIEATQAEQGERIARIEATQASQGERIARVEAMLADLAERMARIEGAVVGAPGRPFSERAAALEEAQATG